jgi:hypothetical protein
MIFYAHRVQFLVHEKWLKSSGAFNTNGFLPHWIYAEYVYD